MFKVLTSKNEIAAIFLSKLSCATSSVGTKYTQRMVLGPSWLEIIFHLLL